MSHRFRRALLGLLIILSCIVAWVLRMEDRSDDYLVKARPRIEKTTQVNSKVGLDESAPAVNQSTPTTDPRDAELTALREELASAKSDLAKLSKPFTSDIWSSTIKTDLAGGETLVAGVFKNSKGRYEATFVTPIKSKNEQGYDEFHYEVKLVAGGETFLQVTGLRELASGAKNTLQNGQVWDHAETQSMFNRMFMDRSIEVVTYPSVSTGEKQAVRMESGSTLLALNLAQNGEGRLTLDSRIERAQPNAQSSPAQEP